MKKALYLFTLFVCCSLLFHSCKEKPKDDSKNRAYTQYISSFTSGVVSAKSNIYVTLFQSVEGVEIGSLVENQDLISISPSVDGSLYWESPQTLRFVPAEKLKQGQEYQVNFKLGEVADTPEELETFSFQFQTLQQSLSIQYDGIEAYDATNLKWQQVKGTISCADFVSTGELHNVFSARQEGEERSLSFVQAADRKTFTFTIDSVQRTEAKQMVVLAWDGEIIQWEDEGTEEIEIPPLGDFKVISASVKDGESQEIVVNFSDPVNQKQDLNGLLFLSSGGSLKIETKGNVVSLFPETRQSGSATLTVSQTVKNSMGYQLVERFTKQITFQNEQPKIEFLGKGVIVPSGQGWKIPFRAVNLKAVNVKVIQVFQDNVSQFFQVNQFDDTRELKRVGRLVLNKEFPLTSDKPIDYGVWNQFGLDLTKYIEKEPGAIYRVVLSFSPKHSLYPCSEAIEETEQWERDEMAEYDEPISGDYYYYDEDEYDTHYHRGYRWDERENPCKASYYYDPEKVQAKNFIASDIGIIAKAGKDKKYHFVVTDLNTSQPLSGVRLKVYNYQNQDLKTLTTDREGFVSAQFKKVPFLVVAERAGLKGYLRIDEQQALSTSMFDVSGKTVQDGLKGLIYGERGVWRPGDSLYLSFMLHDQGQPLPQGHPIVFELYNPKNQLKQRLVENKSKGCIYDFRTATTQDDPTGNWQARVKVGNAVFVKNIKIETVKPNRLKVKLTANTKILKGDEQIELASSWLHGAPANGLKARVQAVVSKAKTEFKAFENYTFDNQMNVIQTEEMPLFDGTLNEQGKATFPLELDLAGYRLPGMLRVRLKNRVFEKGGDFSSDFEVFQYSPFSHYVGLQLPKTKEWGNALRSDQVNKIELATVAETGEAVSRKKVLVQLYDVRWRWWWDRSSDESLGSYIRNYANALVLSDTTYTTNGKGTYNLQFPTESWGRKVLVVTDLESGHSASRVFYTTYGGWRNSGEELPGGAEMLQFSADKNDYAVGEEAVFELPVFDQAMALVSVENGTTVLQKFWVELSRQNNKIILPLSEDMAPNVYVHISVIQPHKHNNDLPIRQYGIIALNVRDKNTVLVPQIQAPESIRPEESYTVKVSEKNGKPMSYTLAVVDEGLLDLTKYRSPNPHHEFYAREALGVYTWDLYNFVAGAFSGELAALLSIGGDEAGGKKADAKANRFKPVVSFLGPFELASGQTATHKLKMDNYIGSVKVMVVAGNGKAYGNAEAVCKVKKPLMVLATAPRVVGPGEEMALPVTVFAMEDKVKSAKIKVITNNLFEGKLNEQTLTFDQIGDKTVYFSLKAKQKLGVGKIQVEVTGAGEKATYEVELQVRPANPVISKGQSFAIEAGKSIEVPVTDFGIEGTNVHTLEVGGIPNVNFSERLKYLIHYPYGCVEQTTSSGFPQLYLKNVMSLTSQQQKSIKTNVMATISRLHQFQLSNGALSYWPGSYTVEQWGTNYAGHFMVEAKKQGYQLPFGFLDKWQRYQMEAANNWQSGSSESRFNDLNQAYRLYTLALSGKPALGAMNRMREWGKYSDVAKWRLAGAYALAGKSNIAREIINQPSKSKNTGDYWQHTYGNAERDLAMLLEVLVVMNDKKMGAEIFGDLVKEMQKTQYYTTQSSAYTLLAIAKYLNLEKSTGSLQASLVVNGNSTDLQLSGKLHQQVLQSSDKVSIKNTGDKTVYINLVSTGVPLFGQEKSASNDLELWVRYKDLNGNGVDVSKLKQGTDFVAEVTVKHTGIKRNYSNVALSQIFPSGWETMNTRLNNEEQIFTSSRFDFQDIRDDRVNTFFNLNKSESKTFFVRLSATYAGKYYLPAIHSEVMYERDINATQKGKWIEVIAN